MARNWIAPKCEYTIEDGRVFTDGKYKQKITGTSMGAILGKSPYDSPFTATTKLMGLWAEDISDKPAVYTGKLLEERIIDYLSAKHPDTGTFYKAEDIFAERSGAHEDWKSDFEDDVFAGHVDGIITKDGKDYILEIKTANRRQIEEKGTWIEGVPEHYLWQVYLYNAFITKQDRAYFGLGVVDSSTYANPNMWVPNKDNCFLFEVKIDQQFVLDKIEEVRGFYADTIGKGMSATADMGNPLDAEVMTHLTDIAGTNEGLMALVKEYSDLASKNKAYVKAIQSDLDKEDELKGRIKDMMSTWDITQAGTVRLIKSERKSFDFKAADADGFDYSKYVKRTASNSLKLME